MWASMHLQHSSTLGPSYFIYILTHFPTLRLSAVIHWTPGSMMIQNFMKSCTFFKALCNLVLTNFPVASLATSPVSPTLKLFQSKLKPHHSSNMPCSFGPLCLCICYSIFLKCFFFSFLGVKPFFTSHGPAHITLSIRLL